MDIIELTLPINKTIYYWWVKYVHCLCIHVCDQAAVHTAEFVAAILVLEGLAHLQDVHWWGTEWCSWWCVVSMAVTFLGGVFAVCLCSSVLSPVFVCSVEGHVGVHVSGV